MVIWNINKTKIIVSTISLLLLLSIFIAFARNENDENPRIVSSRVIYKGRPYAAFTSLVFYNGYFYCSFRDASLHYDPSGNDVGVVKIIKSKTGKKWKEFLTLKMDGIDLRDPKLSVAPNGKIMLLFNAVKYVNGSSVYRQSHVSFISADKSYSEPTPISFTPELNWNWLWDARWIKNTAYGFIYSPYFAFVSSEDGMDYNVISKLDIENSPTEADVIEYEDKFISVVRRKTNALIGISENKGEDWMWFDAGTKIGCPKLFIYKNQIYAVGRAYNKKSTCLALFRVDLSDKKVVEIFRKDSQKDNSYPGVVVKDNRLFISHYSGDEKNSSIYFSRLKF